MQGQAFSLLIGGCTTKLHASLIFQTDMQKKQRGPGRPLTASSAQFKKEVAELKPLLPTDYADFATRMFPELDAKKMRLAVAGRKEYWPGLPALRILAGREPMPAGLVLTVPANQLAAA